MRFDESIVSAEFLRTGIKNQLPYKTKVCTMRSATNFCAIKGHFGYKWPKLSELHYKLFGAGFANAHDASVDVEITAKCFWEMKNRGLIKI
jgi:DNA polymerase-3 subunit epsilon